eukprot:1388534-Pleurochrysis_carterae.AAC.1
MLLYAQSRLFVGRQCKENLAKPIAHKHPVCNAEPSCLYGVINRKVVVSKDITDFRLRFSPVAQHSLPNRLGHGDPLAIEAFVLPQLLAMVDADPKRLQLQRCTYGKGAVQYQHKAVDQSECR